MPNSLRLLKLGEKVRQMLIDGQITTGHARALIPVEDEDEQYLLAQGIFKIDELYINCEDKDIQAKLNKVQVEIILNSTYKSNF